MKRILILNGPNLNMLGRRETGIYGKKTLEQIEEMLQAVAVSLGCAIECQQSNFEGELIEALHEAVDAFDAVILNAGGYSHTSVALRDAISAIAPIPVIEVHLSNIYAREEFRHHSLLAPVCAGTITGFGEQGYMLALRAAASHE